MKGLLPGSFAVLLACSTSTALAAAAEIIGRVKTITGTAFVTSGGARQPAAVGSPIHLNDVVETAEGGSVGLTFKDQSRLSIGSRTRIVIDEYVFAPREKDLSFVTRVQQGTLFYVSGVIAKLAPQEASVVTPEGTIGIRGTRFAVKVEE